MATDVLGLARAICVFLVRAHVCPNTCNAHKTLVFRTDCNEAVPSLCALTLSFAHICCEASLILSTLEPVWKVWIA
eukprot:6177475-Pleurochrysis_carterae.AAC.8